MHDVTRKQNGSINAKRQDGSTYNYGRLKVEFL